MKLGFGLYKHMLDETHYKFARQCGATHIVVHMVDYFGHEKNSKENTNQPVGEKEGWGKAGNASQIWSVEELSKIKQEINKHGMELEAIENFDPAHWYDVLLDGPKKQEQIEGLKQLIRNVGAAGIPVFGYNFSLAGVSSRVMGEFARGGAVSVAMEKEDDTPIPNGMVWNMVYDQDAPPGVMPPATPEQLWSRVQFFLDELLPVAEEAGVRLAAHPDDPPLPFLRKTPRLVHQPELYQKLIDLNPSPANTLEFCLGSVAEMTGGDVYEATDKYSKQGRISYIHFRNVVGKVPNYKEVFIDEGDIDMLMILRILKANNFDGVLIPDHTPQMSCDAPWHSGMAYAMGFMSAALKMI
ncbi:mannonate dehydratase [Sunxiuqinia elliptica]|uniref:mannonate dehydratase n=1 Tax=Sunxiuqinia elliptica TaxID=655355 RepID=A0A4V3BZ77_9BACT|nr:mannonate dehydratase [Sunxiuqinia elliptica]TDO05479.1 D-mannonate dehydratase [Sunxiuqinia elliptica]TDO65025.1 D-mannonate dehydratase [Sunxiuqinia elliptica]